MKWNGLFFVVLLLLLTACSNNTELATQSTGEIDSEHSQQDVVDVTFLDAIGQEHTFTSPPKSIATLNPGIMDILLSVDANVIGRPTISSEMTADVQAIQEIGNPHEPSFEQIAALNPEVLIVPPSFQRFAQTIAATGITVIYEDLNSINDIQDAITRYGELFNSQEKALALNKEIDDAKVTTIDSTQNALIVYGAPGTYLAALDTSLYGDILTTIGGKNIASSLPGLDQYPNYASLSAEKIVEGNPQIIMLITHSDAEMVQAGFEKQMNENAAWKNLDAVKNGQIVILPSSLFDNPGTQIIEAMDYMRNLLEKAEKSS